MSPTALPDQARVVVIGGGVIGTSVAYHLAQAGCPDVLLLERDRLTSGTTWHAAGLMVTFGSTSQTSTQLRRYTRDLYARLPAETGQSTGFAPVGFIELATDADRLEEYRRVAAFNRYCGVDVHEISAREVGDLFPAARTDDVQAGFYVADDGRANPVDVTMALARGARMRGARLIEGVPVTDVLVTDAGTPRARVSGVRTAQGDVACETVVNCTGMWARELAARTGVNVPLQAAEHYYLITDQMPGVSTDWPVLEDPANYAYVREEVGGLMVGLFEPAAAPWRVDGVPPDFSFGQIPPDWDRMGPYVEAAMSRVPATLGAGIRTFFCGPESFTPDLQPVVGEAPEVRGYFVAAGLNSIGILTGGGLGQALAHWILTGHPDIDVTAMDVARLHPFQATPKYRADRTAEVLGQVYAAHYPFKSLQTARGAKRSPVHDRLVSAGAAFRDVSGWEGADWFATSTTDTFTWTAGSGPGVGSTTSSIPSAQSGTGGAARHTWGRPEWFGQWAAEHRAARESAVLMDMSFMAKFLVQGQDAGAVLDHLSAGYEDGATGRITYTQWLNERGTLEADLTVTKLGGERYLVVASDTAHRHVETLVRRALGFGRFAGAHATVTDVTSGYAQFNVQGPNSRRLLQLLTSADMSHEAFGFRAAREIDLGYAQVLCVRITYVGELGYELYVPAEHAADVYDRIADAGRGLGLRPAGLKALSSLRLEKGYRDYGHDIDNTDTVFEAGLGFAVALTRADADGGRAERDFVGRQAVLAQRQQQAERGTPARRLVQVLLRDPEPMMYHAEVLRRDGVAMGYLRAASYGHTLGGAVGLAMVEPATEGGDSAGATPPITQEWLDDGRWDVEIAGQRYPAAVSLAPLYDPGNARIKQ